MNEPVTTAYTEPSERPVWASWSDEQLLGVRMRDLGLRIEGTELESRIAQIHQELGDHGLGFRPYFWLSDEWFTPDDVPGVAIPFYMAHPRLMRLELTQMLEVEGGTPEWCMRILRHETGHAIDNAYRLRRRRRRQALFGRSSEPYPDHYVPRPYSRSFVLHLESAYAQSHPDEDFAETFAVWLTPDSMWAKRYADWPALKKLEYMDRLMRELGTSAPLITTQRRVDPLARMNRTLRHHYRRKRERYGVGNLANLYDRELRRMFSDAPEDRGKLSAARFLSRIRREVRRIVARWTGVYQYTIDQVFNEIVTRCRQLDLRVTQPEEQAALDFVVFLTAQTMSYLHSGQHRVWL